MALPLEVNRNLTGASTPDRNETTRYDFGEFVTQTAQATRRRLELERIADDERRTGQFSQGPRTAAPSEIEEIIHPRRDLQFQPGNYDETVENRVAPNYRDLVRGVVSQRSKSFQTGERTDDFTGRQPDRRTKDRRDCEARGSRPRSSGGRIGNYR